jgi:Cytochrome C oxidase, cbb3-type, subunit III
LRPGLKFASFAGAKQRGISLVTAAALLFCAGCRLDMHTQPRYNPYDPSDFFADGQSARTPVEGTVPRGDLALGPHELLYTGKVNGEVVDEFPFPVTRAVLDRGRERFNIYCEPCHGMTGDGDGTIVQRGFRHPPSLHSDHLRSAPAGHFFDVISNGFGVMYPYGYRVVPRDRWAIVAYIRALQLSRQASINDVPETEREKLRGEAE